MFVVGLSWLGLAAVAVLAARILAQRRAPQPCVAGRDPLAELGERCARGEITREQYEVMRQDLLR